MRERPGLTETRIRTDDNIFFSSTPVEDNFLRARRCTFGIMAEQRA